MARFSKMVMVEDLEARMSRLVEEWNLDPSNGTAQLRGRNQDACVAYGEFRMCERLLEDLKDGRIGV